jgi:hypothetical protein
MIVSVAIKVGALIVSLPKPARHYQVLNMIHDSKMVFRNYPNDQGFLTNTGKFVSRVKAKIIATREKQLLEPSKMRELFSEDLW